ncbi:MAG: hypothetical protein ACRD51_07480, partial [Candidatus Acidiferrum sp.]
MMNSTLHRIAFGIVLPLIALCSFVVVGGFASKGSPRISTRNAYAFLRNGDLWLSYNGKSRSVTRKGLYKDFAVSNDGSNLVLLQVTDP